MNPNQRERQMEGGVSEPDSEPTLESWKEIGTYLGRQVKTVQRWEKTEGLPVRRHSHQRRSSVYAYPSEIDAWRATRDSDVDSPLSVPLWKSLLAPARSLAFGVTLILCLMMVGNGLRPQVAAAQDGEIQTRLLWKNGVQDPGRPSPDGRYLAWVDWKVANGNLAIHDFVTAQDRDLTSGSTGSFAEGPVFSPDGRKLMYGWYEAGTDTWELRVLALDASEPRAFPVESYAGAFSPNGSTVTIIAENSGAQQLTLIDLDDGTMTPLKTLGWRKPEVGNFSPDGRYLVYSAQESQDNLDRAIFVMAADGSSEVELVPAHGANKGAFFTPDGSRVVFISDRSGRWDLWEIAFENGAASGEPTLLKTDIGSVKSLGFSDDGTLFFSQTIAQTDAYIAQLDPDTRTVIGTPQRVTDHFVGESTGPRWSPDGSKLAYTVRQGLTNGRGAAEVTFVIRDLASGAERRYEVPYLTAQLAENYRWFPDGGSLLLVEWRQQTRRSFRRLDLATGEIELLFVAPRGRPESFSLSPDGKSVYYATADRRLIERSLGNGAERVVGELNGMHGVSISPDSSKVAFVHGDQSPNGAVRWSAWTASLQGGQPAKVTAPMDRNLRPGEMPWTPRSDALLAVATPVPPEFKEQPEIWYLPLGGADPHPTGIRMPGFGSISIGPNNQIGFTAAQKAEERVWSLTGAATRTVAANSR